MPLFVPDFIPFEFGGSIKTRPRERSPWESDLPPTRVELVSTYQTQFTGQYLPPPPPIKPTAARQWSGVKSEPMRTTTSDAFVPPPDYIRPPRSFKPLAAKEQAPYTGGEGGSYSGTGLPLSTTTGSSFVPHNAPRTMPIYPTIHKRVDDGFKFCARSTSSDAFPPHSSYRRREPIRPAPNSIGLTGDEHYGGVNAWTSTTQGAFVAHQVVPYRPAPKPISRQPPF